MSIDLKGINFSILLAALGVGLVLIGAAEKLTIAGTGIHVEDIRFRIALIVIGVILLIGAAVFQRTELRRRLPDEDKPNGVSAPKPSPVVPKISQKGAAESFFLTLDDDAIASFPTSVKGAIRLQILARTVVNLVGQYGHVFSSLAQSGCEVQILIVDPESESARHIYANNHVVYLRNAKTALARLAELQDRHKDFIKVRFFPYVPTVSILNVEQRDVSDSFVQVQMYFIHGAIGRDRPIFRVYRTDPWYAVFRDEFESIWKLFPDADVKTYEDKL